MKPIHPHKLEPLERLPVKIGIQIGELSLSLAQLVDLVPGAVFDIDLPESVALVLTVDGTPFASGKIVSEGEQLFLEIQEIFLSAETF